MSSYDRRPDDEPVIIRDKRKFDTDGNLRNPVSGSAAAAAAAGPRSESDDLIAEPLHPMDDAFSQDEVDVQAELLDVRTQLSERTADLQRLTAEYANYRKRVDRDRVVVGQRATGKVVDALLPVLDDVERAGAHGDLTGAFKAVAEKLVTALNGLGLTSFGRPGDPFDPAVHEAVMHDESDDVSVPTASTVMRSGYKIGEQLLRPAMVGVTDPSGSGEAQPVVESLAE
jgi:molecular chaperone GrpE